MQPVATQKRPHATSCNLVQSSCNRVQPVANQSDAMQHVATQSNPVQPVATQKRSFATRCNRSTPERPKATESTDLEQRSPTQDELSHANAKPLQAAGDWVAQCKVPSPSTHLDVDVIQAAPECTAPLTRSSSMTEGRERVKRHVGCAHPAGCTCACRGSASKVEPAPTHEGGCKKSKTNRRGAAQSGTPCRCG